MSPSQLARISKRPILLLDSSALRNLSFELLSVNPYDDPVYGSDLFLKLSGFDAIGAIATSDMCVMETTGRYQDMIVHHRNTPSDSSFAMGRLALDRLFRSASHHGVGGAPDPGRTAPAHCGNSRSTGRCLANRC